MRRTKKEIQLEAVKAILSGELLLEEAMARYSVKDRRTMLSWVRKIAPILKENSQSIEAHEDIHARQPIKPVRIQEAIVGLDYHDLWVENNALLRKVISLQERLSELQAQNEQLNRHRNMLLEKVTSLELKVELKDKSRVAKQIMD